MGAQWKQKGREIEANKKGKLIGKLIREVMIAAKLGGADPEYNPRLFAALDKARKASVTRDTIDRALKKAGGAGGESVELELVTFEGFAPHKVPLVVECLTDNRNRTAPDMRSLFKDGRFGAKVMFFFDHLGHIEATHESAGLDLETAALEVGADDVEPLEETPEESTGARFYTAPAALDAVTKALRDAGWVVSESEMGYRAKEKSSVTPEQREKHEAFLERIDDHDDCHRIYSA
jgi:YebC/PmpR family DNA-binding regulatory protein